MTPDEYIFQQASKTYYNATLLFPKRTREDVTKLYSFLRTADNYVDALPPRRNEFRNLMATWQEYRAKPMEGLAPHKDDTLNVRVTKNMCRLVIQHEFEPSWVDAFLHSMELDTRKKMYHTLDDTLRYVHGSAEVVGLMMARVMHLPEKAMDAAALHGRAMQWVNFLRDISEDIELGRQYFPQTDLREHGLSDLGELTTKAHSEAFRAFIAFQLSRYQEWQRAANQAMGLVPKRYRIPIETAADAYQWTARQIAKDPFVVYRRKVKPSRARLMGNAFVHAFD